ncbi:MAG: energy transducer TonB [Erythrobacter sp.]|nr:energy transducer TonB [Erythrobacter sp.]
MVRRGALIFALALVAPAAAQQAAPAPPPLVTIVPAPGETDLYEAPKVERVKAVDIPQWAKDAGHNGLATYRATIAPDNSLIGLELKSSSGSAVIDAAVKARAETLWYRAGTDAAGKPVESRTLVSMEYARYDWKSPGGGVETYTCGDLVREFDWFSALDPKPELPFLPQQVYEELRMWARIEKREQFDHKAMPAEIAARAAHWPLLIERCRKAPERLMLDEIDYPDTFRRRMAQY